MKNLIILGAGGFGHVVYEIESALHKWKNIYFLDDNPDSNAVGKLADFTNFSREDYFFFIAIGNNAIRKKWTERLTEKNYKLINCIAPSAVICKSVSLGRGNAILHQAIVNSNVKIGDGTIINCGAILDHDVVIKNYAHIGLGSIIKANKFIEPLEKIEANEVRKNNN